MVRRDKNSKIIYFCLRSNFCGSTTLKRIITGDETWVVYDNVVRKGSWSKRYEPAQSTSKADIHQKKVMLIVWWNFKGIVYFELLPRNQTINSYVYCRQLMKLNKEIKEKRFKAIQMRLSKMSWLVFCL